jgi:transposase
MATATMSHIAQASLAPPPLSLACALGQHTWQFGCTMGMAPHPRERTIPAGALDPFQPERTRATQRCGWPEDAGVVSCDEAGRDGGWLHRTWVAHGVTPHVIDSASLAGKRRQRRAKTARREVHQRLPMLLRPRTGEWQVERGVRVPSVEEEDRRPRVRALPPAPWARRRVRKRRQGLLAGYGVPLAPQGDVDAQRDQGPPWDGAPLPPALRRRLTRAWQQGGVLTAPSQTLAAPRRGLGVHRAWR